MPIATPSTTEMRIVSAASSSVTGKAADELVEDGLARPVRLAEVSLSTMPPIQSAYWT